MTSRRSRARLIKVQAKPARTTSGPRGLVATHPVATATAAGAAVLALAAWVNSREAATAERENPPAGRFIEVDGVRLHYVEHGTGEPLVLLHGNGSMIQDFSSSGLIRMASRRYRVIAFDRPGFGHSDRPRSTVWTAEAQADLIQAALARIGVSRATVFGHSWGSQVAVALALKHPEAVGGLVLASGYYYPSVRIDALIMSGPAIPGIGDVLRYTIAPPLARLIWPLLTRKIFGPAPVPAKFEAFPKEMAFRPSQIRAAAADTALMIPNAVSAQGRYSELAMPVVIIAGEEDRHVATDDQSGRLHTEIPHSTFHRVPGAGHMVHQTATERVMAAIDEAAEAGRTAPGMRLAA